MSLKEEGCFGYTFERKYYKRGQTFIKRSLRSREFKTGHRGLHIPYRGIDRLKNEAACLRYISDNTDVPVPQLLCDFEDDGAYYVISEYVEGTSMSDLTEEQRLEVEVELETHLTTLRNHSSSTLGGPSGIVIPPFRVTRKTGQVEWESKAKIGRDSEPPFVFCHNDLSQQNIIVDPDTLRIRAIIDWEYAGFFPEQFEWRIFKRKGPSSALEGEIDDTDDLIRFLSQYQIQERSEDN